MAFINSVIAWIQANGAVFWAALSVLVVSVVHFLWTINPKLKSSGPLHAIYVFFGGEKGL